MQGRKEANQMRDGSVLGFDHVAITVADIQRTCDFYERVLDGRVETDYQVNGKTIVRRLVIGGAVLNIHQEGNGVDLVARRPTPGSADLCLRWNGTIQEAVARLQKEGVAIREGPVPRQSSDGDDGESVYFIDPDGNLIELLTSRRPSA
jgi:catechol 2,3-dioxygenase-like lactoylglutathione lyase family enzyme